MGIDPQRIAIGGGSAGEFIWTPHNNLVGWTALLGGAPGGDGVSPYAAPARAESLAGLPPTYISTQALQRAFEPAPSLATALTR
jgi:acetyl esterase/lipase